MVSDDVVTAPDVLSIQKPKQAQRPRIEVDRTSKAAEKYGCSED